MKYLDFINGIFHCCAYTIILYSTTFHSISTISRLIIGKCIDSRLILLIL